MVWVKDPVGGIVGFCTKVGVAGIGVGIGVNVGITVGINVGVADATGVILADGLPEGGVAETTGETTGVIVPGPPSPGVTVIDVTGGVPPVPVVHAPDPMFAVPSVAL